ncbi:putative solute-binding protein [Acinetobacter dispersus]|uniref:putative solute-binding protein n=1 Tax=Acinetobacter dispersus TaxID=70348 RepID=UPI0021CD550E|nr:putative solute-binding protein [Acinetobacter dispersus]MCU4336909.1 RND transporter [Acinetobacter dispersus]
MRKIICMVLLGLITTASWAVEQTWCVFDPLSTKGDISRRLQDIRLYALQNQVQLDFQTFKNEKEAIQAFDQRKCSGLVASNFNTYRYNRFMGTTGGIGLIPNNRVARVFLQLLNNSNVEKRMVEADYEMLGMIPIGTAYMIMNTQQINKVSQLKNKTIGILENNPPQQALVQSVGAKPVYVDFSNAVESFKQKKIDILAAPAYGILPYNLKKEFGADTQVVNFPMAYFAMNIVIRPQVYPAGFGHQIRSWFVRNSNVLAAQAIQWENHLPAYYWADISGYEKQGYDAMVVKIRNRYVDSGYYDAYFVSLIKRLRCLDDPKYLECR